MKRIEQIIALRSIILRKIDILDNDFKYLSNRDEMEFNIDLKKFYISRVNYLNEELKKLQK